MMKFSIFSKIATLLGAILGAYTFGYTQNTLTEPLDSYCLAYDSTFNLSQKANSLWEKIKTEDSVIIAKTGAKVDYIQEGFIYQSADNTICTVDTNGVVRWTSPKTGRLQYGIKYRRILTFYFEDTAHWSQETGCPKAQMFNETDTCSSAYWEHNFFDSTGIVSPKGLFAVKSTSAQTTTLGTLKGWIQIEKGINLSKKPEIISLSNTNCFPEISSPFLSLKVGQEYADFDQLWYFNENQNLSIVNSKDKDTSVDLKWTKQDPNVLSGEIFYTVSGCSNRNTPLTDTLRVGVLTPRPKIETDSCLLTSLNYLEAFVMEPHPQLTYHWQFQNKNTILVAGGEDSAKIEVGNFLSGDLRMIAEGGCVADTQWIHIARGLGSNVHIENIDSLRPACFFSGDSLRFTLSPSFEDELVWYYPAKWRVVEEESSNREQKVRVASNEGGISDTIKVSTMHCPLQLSLFSIMIQDTLPQIKIESTGSLSAGSPFRFVAEVNENITKYRWNIPIWNFEFESDSNIYEGRVPDTATEGGIVILTATYCEKQTYDTATFCLYPQKPSFISEPTDYCVNLGTSTNLQYTLSVTVGIDSLKWELPETWKVKRYEKKSKDTVEITMLLNEPLESRGNRKSFTIVGVNGCGQSDSVKSAEVLITGNTNVPEDMELHEKYYLYPTDEDIATWDSAWGEPLPQTYTCDVFFTIQNNREEEMLEEIFLNLEIDIPLWYIYNIDFSIERYENPMLDLLDGSACPNDKKYSSYVEIKNNKGCKNVWRFTVIADSEDTLPTIDENMTEILSLKSTKKENLGSRRLKRKTINLPFNKNLNITKQSQALISSFVLSPNPSLNTVHLKMIKEENTEVKWTIYDLIGKQKKEIRSRDNQIDIDVSSYPPGLYLLKGNDTQGNVLITTKFIKK